VARGTYIYAVNDGVTGSAPQSATVTYPAVTSGQTRYAAMLLAQRFPGDGERAQALRKRSK